MMRYKQITDYLQKKIENKCLCSGDRIASIREMSALFHCSKATVLRAYSKLEEKHIIYSVPKSGYYVVNSQQSDFAAGSVIDFATMMPAAEVIPYLEFRHCLNQALDIYQEKSFMFNEKQGLKDLRVALAKQLQDYQIFTNFADIFITAGAQQTIDILVRMPFPNGKKTVLVEQPTYAGILASLKLAGINAIGIARDYNGINFELLENYFKNGNIKFFYTMSRYQNPTGSSYVAKEKELILLLARKYDVYIVEDDYLAEFNLDKKSDPLYALDKAEHTIYVKSYSKVCLPGLRIGAVLLPQAFRNVFLAYKRCVDPYASSILQGALTMFMKNGMYAHHVQSINNFYAQRIIALINACKQLSEEVKWQQFAHCAFAFLELPAKVNVCSLVTNLQRKNILVQDVNKWYLPGFTRKNGIRLCVYQVAEENIAKGISIINDEINYWLRQRTIMPQSFYEE